MPAIELTGWLMRQGALSSRYGFLIEHDFFGIPLHAFPNHAL